MVNPDASGHEVPITLLTSPYFLSDPGHGWTDVDEQLGFDLNTGKRNGGFVRNFAEQLARQSTRSRDVETLSPRGGRHLHVHAVGERRDLGAVRAHDGAAGVEVGAARVGLGDHTPGGPAVRVGRHRGQQRGRFVRVRARRAQPALVRRPQLLGHEPLRRPAHVLDDRDLPEPRRGRRLDHGPLRPDVGADVRLPSPSAPRSATAGSRRSRPTPSPIASTHSPAAQAASRPPRPDRAWRATHRRTR